MISRFMNGKQFFAVQYFHAESERNRYVASYVASLWLKFLHPFLNAGLAKPVSSILSIDRERLVSKRSPDRHPCLSRPESE